MKKPSKKQIQEEIVDAIAAHRREHRPGTTWKPPRVAFAAADPLFARLKTVIGPTHATPDELLPTAETVIVYFLPFTEDIPRSNADGDHASRAWATAYVETNALLTAINAHLATFLRAAGHRATVVPPPTTSTSSG